METKSFLEFALTELEKRYPINGIYEPLIDEKTQIAEIENLTKAIKYEQCFFVVNLLKRKLEHVHGISQWLGYPDDTFGFIDYFKIIHPRHRAALNLSAMSAFDTANTPEVTLGFMSPRIVVQLPLLHADGTYVLMKRSLYPFQIDKSGKVLAYLNHFSVIKQYDEQDNLHPEISKSFTTANSAAAELYATENEKNRAKMKILESFNKNELRILSFLVKNPEASNSEISTALDLSLNSLNKSFNSRILNKARAEFQTEQFDSLKSVVIYLKSEGIF
jgi:hypothetical protein